MNWSRRALEVAQPLAQITYHLRNLELWRDNVEIWMITRNQRGWVITLAQHVRLTQTAPSQPENRHRLAPGPDARVEVIRRDPRDIATLADEVVGSIARLLGRQAAREWFHAEEAKHGA
jgi:hypothetical protein